MKKYLLLFFLLQTFCSSSQELGLKKGVVIDTLIVNDSISERFLLYLPTCFTHSKEWPIIFVFDVAGRSREALSMFKTSAEKEGYILAASNNIHDSLSVSENVRTTKRMMNSVYASLPIHKNRSYTAGFSSGARLASLMPTFIKNIKGVISCGVPIANIEVLNPKKIVHFIGVVGNEDFNYTSMLNNQKVLNKLKLPNNLIFFEGGHHWPPKEYLSKALQILTLSSMSNGDVPKDTLFIEASYRNSYNTINAIVAKKPLFAHKIMQQMLTIYRPFMQMDSLQERTNRLRKSKAYRSNNRNQNAVFFKEALLKEDYKFYLEEDITTYNYNNLGWWNYQMEELENYNNSVNTYERQMGKRLKLYVKDFIAAKINGMQLNATADKEALNFLWMLSTVISPKNYSPYLKIISFNAKIGDYDTSLFYVEELLKNGYTNKDVLYALKNTALLRISPEFNHIVSKYLKDARYNRVDE